MMDVWKTLRDLAISFYFYCMSYKLTIVLCTVKSSSLRLYMISPNVDTYPSMDALSSSKYAYVGASFWTFSWSFSIYCFATCKFFSIFLFSDMRYFVFDLVAPAKAKLVAIMASVFLMVSATITLSLMNAGDVIYSRKCFFLACTIFFWSSS